MTEMTRVLEQYVAEPDLQLPARLQQLAGNLEREFQELEAKKEEYCKCIRSTLESWVEFQAILKELSECLQTSQSEFSQLERVGSFAMEFSSLEFRLKVC